MPNTHRIMPGQSVDINAIETDGKLLYENGKERGEKEFKALRKELRDLQARLYSEDKRSLLLVFQAMDAGGKDGLPG